MNVLVYAGAEVIPASLSHTTTLLKSLLTPHYSVQSLTTQAFKSQPWFQNCALLVLPQCNTISDPLISSRSLQTFVGTGGSLLGLGYGLEITSARSADRGRSIQFFDSTTSLTTIVGLLANEHMDEPSSTSGEEQPSNADRQGFLISKGASFEVLARFSSGEPCAVKTQVGQGQVSVWSSSPENPLRLVDSASDTAQDKGRDDLGNTLNALGLKTSDESSRTTQPLPQFLVAAGGTEDRTSLALSELKVSSDPSVNQTFVDENDTFIFHGAQSSQKTMQTSRASMAADEEIHKEKHIIVFPSGQFPDTFTTPLFDLQRYFSVLQESGEKTNIGKLVLYSEVVTSTQSMLDRNPRFLSLIPAPLVSIASQQLTGRGRGANVWLSPAGCLQFSILLRLPLASFPANKLVFIQYLFALAVVEACRDEAVLGARGDQVRLKWPNDIYVDVGEKKKIGGILVNTSFEGGTVNIVIGCGLNVLNEPPIFSLSQLLPKGSATVSMEATAATILTKFDKMWNEFVQGRGSFDPFMDLYLDRWLHSDQLVTLTTVTPHRSVRICGITSDHGLLRTMPEPSGRSSEDEGFIDLQPDGNSFDLMAGLIKMKS